MSDAMTPAKGEKMPQAPEQWFYLAGKYEEALFREEEKNSKLRQKVNKLEQKLEKAILQERERAANIVEVRLNTLAIGQDIAKAIREG